jgi:hypothetical protein
MPLTRTRTHDYEPRREAAMAAFAKSWRMESARIKTKIKARNLCFPPPEMLG